MKYGGKTFLVDPVVRKKGVDVGCRDKQEPYRASHYAGQRDYGRPAWDTYHETIDHLGGALPTVQFHIYSTFGFGKCGTNNGGDRPLSNEKVMHVWE